ncbi:hypothetical protein F0562_015201 [Nyssa sinensis]|uniref:Tf2-1-like SH3-like domain-containing protein n=1 Tax=Nyssa sinensis TaxID=561372 RepID=A0A5J4ZGS2_9ASTE|nr:hypothetical protein F0562_015201 [Nyssa sinensis]
MDMGQCSRSKRSIEHGEILESVKGLIDEYDDVCLHKLAAELPPLWDVQHQIDLAYVPNLKRVNDKVEDLISQIQEIHKSTKRNLVEPTAKYKSDADKKCHRVKFDVGDFVWAILVKDHFSMGEYNKLATRKIALLEVPEKINPNAYRLKLPTDDTLNPVLDIHGNELQAGEGYYALPAIGALGWGGGLTSFRPLYVVQTPFEADNARPLVFRPILHKEDIIRVSTPLNIEFLNTSAFCCQSTVWTVESSFITTNGERGCRIPNFQIHKSKETLTVATYKFVYCGATMPCQDIGRSCVNGVRALTLGVEPYEMAFVKAEGSQSENITNAGLVF